MTTSPLTVRREGSGPELLLVHGGASPGPTWRGIEPLAARWTLGYVYRRGYPPSPPSLRPGSDFEVDADDLAPLLAGRPHVAAHSYGGLGVLLAAAADPARVRSLTIIETPLYRAALDDPEVARLKALGDTFLRDGPDTDPAMLREFMRLSGAGDFPPGPLPEKLMYSIRRAHGGRPPGEAAPDLERIRRAGVPVLIASGGHAPGLETLADRMAAALGGERAVLPGAGHFVAAAPGFADRLERFLASAA